MACDGRGNDIAPIFSIIDKAKNMSKSITDLSVVRMMKIVYDCYCEKRGALAESIHLNPLGWTLKDFNSSTSSVIPQTSREEIVTKIRNTRLDVGLIVAGFDGRGKGHIFTVDDDDYRAHPRRHDRPGYHAIGSGAGSLST